MPIPTTTVTGIRLNPDSSPAVGTRVKITPTATQPGSDGTIVMSTVTALVNPADGTIGIPTIVNDVITGYEPMVVVNNTDYPNLQYIVAETVRGEFGGIPLLYVVTPTGSTLDLDTCPRAPFNGFGITAPVYSGYVLASAIGQADGVAGLDAEGLVPLDQLPGSSGGGGTVTKVNSVSPDGTGNVVLTATNVGADASGAASTAQTNAENYANTQVAAEQTRAQGAETTLTTNLSSEVTRATNAEALLVPLTQKGVNSGVATLDSSGKIPGSQLPALAINSIYTVVSQAAMLALAANQGDLAVRTDLSPNQVFILKQTPASTLANWVEISVTSSAVTSVNTRVGAVTGLAEENDLVVEINRAQAAEATLVSKANNLSDLANLATALSNLHGVPNNASSGIVGNYVVVGPTAYTFNLPSASGAYHVLFKSQTTSDASLVLGDQGAIRGEAGLATDNDFHFKTVTGTAGSEVFVDALILKNTTAYVYVPLRLGIGTATPGQPLHIASASAAGRLGVKIENTASATGNSNSALIELKGNSPVAAVDWLFGTDFGINGNNNFFVQDGNNGLRLFIDGTGRTVLGDSSTTAPDANSLDVVGSIKTRGVRGVGAVNFCGQKATAGAPTTGTWAVGDFIIDSKGMPWVCTGAGTSGTWSGWQADGGTATAGAVVPHQVRRDTLANWLSHSTVVLAAGEVAYETDTFGIKIGDGSSTWAALPYPRVSGLWTPSQSGLIAATADAGMMPSQGAVPSGRPMFFPVRIDRNVSIVNLLTGFVNGGTAPASNSNTYMAVYVCAGGPGSSGGALLGQTAELSTSINGASGNQAQILSPVQLSGVNTPIAAQPIGEWIYLMLLNTNVPGATAAQWIATRLYGTNFQNVVTGSIARVFKNSSGSTMTTPPATVPTLVASGTDIMAWVAITQ